VCCVRFSSTHTASASPAIIRTARSSASSTPGGEGLWTVNFRQPSYEFTFNVGIDLLFKPLELTPRI
jgi:hypothetical protein